MPIAFRSFLALLLVFGTAAHASTLTRGMGNAPESLDPHKAVGTSASAVSYDLFEGLVTIGPRGELAPGAAESWEKSADGTVYRFRLRPNLKWSDGEPLTAEDFVYSFRRLVTPETGARYASFVYVIDNARPIIAGKADPATLGVKAVDPRTVEFKLEGPAPQFLEILAGVAAVPVPRHALEKFGREWTRPGKLVSNGAYVLERYIPNTALELRRNPRFHAAKDVRTEHVKYIPIEDDGASLKRYLGGELDITLRYPMEQLAELRRTRPKEVHFSPGLGSTMLVVNTRKPGLSDARVRRALALAIDRDALTEKILRDTAEPAYGIVPTSVSNFDSHAPDWKGKPLAARQAEARKLLAAAGYGSSKPLEITLRYYTEGRTRTIGVAIASMWRAIGVNTKLANSDMGSVISAVRTGNYEVSLYAWYSSFDDPYTFLDLLLTKRQGSATGYSNAAYDEAFRKGNILGDVEARGKALAAAEAIALDDYPIIPLYFPYGQRLVRTNVDGWIDNSRGANLSRYLSVK